MYGSCCAGDVAKLWNTEMLLLVCVWVISLSICGLV